MKEVLKWVKTLIEIALIAGIVYLIVSFLNGVGMVRR